MPEFAEVETVKETLKKQVLNKQIKEVDIYWNKIIEYPYLEDFSNMIKGQIIIDINRRGKWLIFVLNDFYLLSHLRMEGKYFLKQNGDEVKKHEHVIIRFTDNTELRYHDTRKFGKMYLLKQNELDTKGPLINLGLEPFDDNLTISYLKNKLKKRIISIKTSLLDQSIIAGIGNIYADEILFKARINPLKKSNKLTKNDLQAIIDSTKEVLSKAVEAGGTTIRSYTSSEGITGRFQHELYVHGREGKPCKLCGTLIKKIKVGGRGTYYCPVCQKNK
jgi:formamidopyrimidine-DNA glycosylase